MTTKRQREYMDEAGRLGAKVASIHQTGSNHFRLVLTSRGKAQSFLIGNSDSDRRAFLNWRARVKRWLKETHDAQENPPHSRPQLHQLGRRASAP